WDTLLQGSTKDGRPDEGRPREGRMPPRDDPPEDPDPRARYPPPPGRFRTGAGVPLRRPPSAADRSGADHEVVESAGLRGGSPVVPVVLQEDRVDPVGVVRPEEIQALPPRLGHPVDPEL